MKFCIIIPAYNHTETLLPLLDKVCSCARVIVVDDGSTPAISLDTSKCELLRLEKNSGKANALKRGFTRATELGFTHAITMDADGQHSPHCIEEFISTAKKNPHAIISGTRNFDLPEVPKGRRFLNKFSNFWFRAETGFSAADTQCGYRCYPLEEIAKLKMDFGGFVFETELLVKAAWAGVEIVEISIPTIYTRESVGKSHYKPFADTMKFTMMNTRLFFTSLFLPNSALKRIAKK